ncbi:MAG: hypothetical protein AB1600_00310 [Bacteroidota bacterium]
MSAVKIVQEYNYPDDGANHTKGTHDIQMSLRNLCSYAANRNVLVYLELWESRRYSQVVEVALLRKKVNVELLERLESINGMDHKYAEHYIIALLNELILLQ